MLRRSTPIQRYFNEVYVPMNFGPPSPLKKFSSRFFRTTASEITTHCISLLRDQPPKSVLDLGCGSGAFLANLAIAFPLERAVGVDFSAKAIAIAEGRLNDRRRFSFECASVEHCHGLRERYDAVLAIGLFDYLPFDAAFFDLLLKAATQTVVVTLPRKRARLQRLARRAWLHFNGVQLCAYSTADVERIAQSTPRAAAFSIRITHPPDLPDNEWLVARRLEAPEQATF